MTKQMKKNVYEAPVTERFLVEMEGAICSASIVNGNTSEVETTGHELNEVDVTSHSWNTDENGGGWQ